MLVADEPFFEMWNSVTTTYLAHPDFFNDPQAMSLVIETEGYDQGTIRESAWGRQVEVVLDLASKGKDAFYDYVLAQFKRNYAHNQFGG